MQHWQFTMAQRATEIECARSLYQKAATLLDRGDRSAEPEAAMAKAYGTRLAVDLSGTPSRCTARSASPPR